MTLPQAIQLASVADDALDAAIKSAGFVSRWDIGVTRSGVLEIHLALLAKYAADAEVHRLFCELRGEKNYVGIDGKLHPVRAFDAVIDQREPERIALAGRFLQ